MAKSQIVRELEEVAFRGWPAEVVVDQGGWRVRFTPGGVTRRANSVWPNVWRDEGPVAASVDAVEAFYAGRAAPARFMITDAALPAELPALLERRGYTVEVKVNVETVPLDAFRTAGQPPQVTTSVADAPSDEWFAIAADRGRFAEMKEPYRGLLDRIGSRGGFALARWRGKPVAIGLGVVDGPWLGIFNMSTLPEARRRRAATAVLGALVGWGSARGATRAYLQVEDDNGAALALYGACGFSFEYGYRYLTKRCS